MRARSQRRAVGALCALLAAGLVAGMALAGCSLPGLSSDSTRPNLAAATNKAISQLQAILGLPMGAITRSSGQPMFSDSEAALTWSGGRADVDAETGLIRCVLLEPKETTTGAALSNTVLDKEADRIVGLLGWDAAALASQGFTRGTSRSVDRGAAGSVYQKTWVGHDEEGIANQGLIEIGIDKATGELRSFLFSPGPREAAAVPQKVTKNEAVNIATVAAVRSPSEEETTTSTLRGGTTSTLRGGTTSTLAGVTTTTMSPSQLKVENATLVHTDAPGITGGGDALVWIVKLSRSTPAGKIAVTVYVDAVSGEVLGVMSAG